MTFPDGASDPAFSPTAAEAVIRNPDTTETPLASPADYAIVGANLYTTLAWDATHEIVIYDEPDFLQASG